MSELALRILWVAAANAAIASVVILAAWLALRKGQPRLAHVLCLVALLKLVTPPLVRFAVLPPVAAPAVDVALAVEAALAQPSSAEPAVAAPAVPANAFAWPLAILSTILLGTALLLGRALTRAARFRRALALATQAPAPLLLRLRTLARRMHIEPCPDLLVVPARISPMLCVFDRRAHVLLPQALLASVSPAELDALLAHELAHAGRRDHWIRVLELLAVGLYWWLPSLWWLRRTLRAAEERCCDERVLQALPGHGRAYADALLTTLDFLAGTTRAMPPVACGAGAFCDLKTRLTTIMSDSHSRPLSFAVRAVLLAGAAAILPIAPTMAQDDARVDDKARAELRAAMDEIKKLRAEMEAMRAELRQDGASDKGLIARLLHDAQSTEHTAKVNETVEQAVHEHVRKALANARDHATKLDQDQLREHLAEIGEQATEHVHKALAEAHAHLSQLDHDKIQEHLEQASRYSAAHVDQAKKAAYDATRNLHEHLAKAYADQSGAAQALRESAERQRNSAADATDIARQAIERAHAALQRLHKRGADAEDDADKADDKTEANAERQAVIERLRAKGAAGKASAADRADEIQVLREQVKQLQQQLEKMAKQQATLDRARNPK